MVLQDHSTCLTAKLSARRPPAIHLYRTSVLYYLPVVTGRCRRHTCHFMPYWRYRYHRYACGIVAAPIYEPAPVISEHGSMSTIMDEKFRGMAMCSFSSYETLQLDAQSLPMHHALGVATMLYAFPIYRHSRNPACLKTALFACHLRTEAALHCILAPTRFRIL